MQVMGQPHPAQACFILCSEDCKALSRSLDQRVIRPLDHPEGAWPQDIWTGPPAPEEEAEARPPQGKKAKTMGKKGGGKKRR